MQLLRFWYSLHDLIRFDIVLLYFYPIHEIHDQWNIHWKLMNICINNTLNYYILLIEKLTHDATISRHYHNLLDNIDILSPLYTFLPFVVHRQITWAHRFWSITDVKHCWYCLMFGCRNLPGAVDKSIWLDSDIKPWVLITMYDLLNCGCKTNDSNQSLWPQALIFRFSPQSLSGSWGGPVSWKWMKG